MSFLNLDNHSCGFGYHPPIRGFHNVKSSKGELSVIQYGPSLTKNFSVPMEDLMAFGRQFHATGEVPREVKELARNLPDFLINEDATDSYAVFLASILPRFFNKGKTPYWFKELPEWRDVPYELNFQWWNAFLDKYPELKQKVLPRCKNQFSYSGPGESNNTSLFFHGWNITAPFQISVDGDEIRFSKWFEKGDLALSDDEFWVLFRSKDLNYELYDLFRSIGFCNSARGYRFVQHAARDYFRYLLRMEKLSSILEGQEVQP